MEQCLLDLPKAEVALTSTCRVLPSVAPCAIDQHVEVETNTLTCRKVVFLGNIAVEITDCYQFRSRPNTLQNSLLQGKNIVKNIVKAFKHWLTQKGLADHQCTLEDILDCHKFNNRLIVLLLQSRLRQPFCRFISAELQSWLKRSEVANKELHLAAGKAYLTLASSTTELQAFIRKKCRGRGM